MNHQPLPITAFVDQVARDKAQNAANEAQRAMDAVQSHEDLCGDRYNNINETLTTIKRILGWAGTTIFMLMTATLGWLVVQQINHNDDNEKLLRGQVTMLQQQQQPRPAAEPSAH